MRGSPDTSRCSNLQNRSTSERSNNFVWQKLLHPFQVVNLRERVALYDPIDVLRWFILTFEAHRVRVLVCGGDGTVNWILGMLDQLDAEGIWLIQLWSPAPIGQ